MLANKLQTITAAARDSKAAAAVFSTNAHLGLPVRSNDSYRFVHECVHITVTRAEALNSE